MISIIVPTYNERDNIAPLLERLDGVLGAHGYGYEVVVVDDDSPDETWKVATELGAEYPVEVVRRRDRRGRASAVLRGIREANSDIVVGFDADLQLPAEKIPELVGEIERGADIAVAGKYLSTRGARNLGVVGRVLSKGENLVAKLFLPELRQLTDVSDFFAMRRSVIDGVEIDIVGGNKLIVNVLVQGEYDTVTETSYEIGVRNEGESKLGVRAALDTFAHLVELWYRERIRRRLFA